MISKFVNRQTTKIKFVKVTTKIDVYRKCRILRVCDEMKIVRAQKQ